MVTARAADGGGKVIVGIDAGGSSTRVRAQAGSVLVFEGAGGPGNPVMTRPETVRASYHAALGGCPAASRVAACVSGGGGPAQRAQIADLLSARFPGANVYVAPDHVGAFLAAPPGSDICILAGTGSAVCGRGADGGFVVSGGRGWILGDHGGAARLGQAALEHYVRDVAGIPAPFTDAVKRLFGDADRRAVVHSVHAAQNPAPLLARAAPLLTAAAEGGERWAIERLGLEMSALAFTAARHIDTYLPGTATVHVAISGGVWSSPAAQAALTSALGQASSRPVTVTRSLADPVDGAVRLAASLPL